MYGPICENQASRLRGHEDSADDLDSFVAVDRKTIRRNADESADLPIDATRFERTAIHVGLLVYGLGLKIVCGKSPKPRGAGLLLIEEKGSIQRIVERNLRETL